MDKNQSLYPMVHYRSTLDSIGAQWALARSVLGWTVIKSFEAGRERERERERDRLSDVYLSLFGVLFSSIYSSVLAVCGHLQHSGIKWSLGLGGASKRDLCCSAEDGESTRNCVT